MDLPSHGARMHDLQTDSIGVLCRLHASTVTDHAPHVPKLQRIRQNTFLNVRGNGQKGYERQRSF